MTKRKSDPLEGSWLQGYSTPARTLLDEFTDEQLANFDARDERALVGKAATPAPAGYLPSDRETQLIRIAWARWAKYQPGDPEKAAREAEAAVERWIRANTIPATPAPTENVA